MHPAEGAHSLSERVAGVPHALHVCAQVIGPAAAQAWLAEVSATLGLRYYFSHAHDFDTKPGLARPWLMKQMGAPHAPLPCQATD